MTFGSGSLCWYCIRDDQVFLGGKPGSLSPKLFIMTVGDQGDMVFAVRAFAPLFQDCAAE